MREEIFGKFPLINPDINVDAGFISKLENQFLSAVQASITAAGGIDSASFRTNLFDNTKTALGTLLFPNSLVVTQTQSPEIRFRIKGSDVYHSGFRLDLPGLGLELYDPGDVKVDVDVDMPVPRSGVELRLDARLRL